MNWLPKTGLLLISLLVIHSGFSQYILNGSAQKNSCNCYTLTQPLSFQSGSVWNSNKINLNNGFDFWFNVFLGCSDAGADGIVFILQPISTSVGTSGEGMGFGGVLPSIGIALDTYQNLNLSDPSFDHISIQSNGQINHTSDLAGPIAISSTSSNVEDCQWHRLRITWDPSSLWLRAYFDEVLRVEKQIDLITTIFNNDPHVYWGFTGATGGQVNLQQFCTALDPDFTVNLTAAGGCVGQPLQFSNTSESFAPITSYTWDFGDNTGSNQSNPPPHVYSQPGIYEVNLKILGQDGCENDTSRKIEIGEIPSAELQIWDTCFGQVPRVVFNTAGTGTQSSWEADFSLPPGPPPPSFAQVPVGDHEVKLVVSSLWGCGTADTAIALFSVLPVPALSFAFERDCFDISFTASQTDNLTQVLQWKWNFGDNSGASVQNPVHHFGQPGTYNVALQAIAGNGCGSDIVSETISIVNAYVYAGNDTVIIRNQPAQLFAQANGAVHWSPSTGLSATGVPNPITTLSGDQTYYITVTTDDGCMATDTLHVKTFTGPAVYLPNAFTPNNDRLNDVFRPTYVGISNITGFRVFNRWGQLMFSTADRHAGWDGRAGGKEQPTGTYVWIATGINYRNEPFVYRGTVTLIR